jgi:transcriptional regulator GlxA family with amidase domain
VSDGGKAWTTSGVSAGTDGCLAMLEHIYGSTSDGVSYADLVCDSMEWNRVRDPADDPFAVKNNVKDVLPTA